MKARQRIQMIADKGSFYELYSNMKADDPLNFPGYKDKLETVRVASSENEAVVCGTAAIGKQKCCLFVMESYFMMGSMGSAVGEKITLLFEYAVQHRLPVIGFTVSGGARMQEGLLSLMQMAKTSAAVKRHSDAGLLYIAVLTDPTTGEILAACSYPTYDQTDLENAKTEDMNLRLVTDATSPARSLRHSWRRRLRLGRRAIEHVV